MKTLFQVTLSAESLPSSAVRFCLKFLSLHTCLFLCLITWHLSVSLASCFECLLVFTFPPFLEKSNRVVPRECTGHSKHLLPTTQEKTLHITSPDGQHRNQIDYILCSQRWKSSIQSAKTRLEADCGSDHQLLIAKFRLKLKKVGKTSRPFRYDLNQIPYDYTVEVRNRFKGLNLIECLMNYGMRFVTLYRRQGSRPFPWKRNAKKQNGCLGRPYK